MRTTTIMAGGLAGALLCLMGCGVDPGIRQPPRTDAKLRVRIQDPKADADFRAAQEKWTRRAEIYDRMDARSFFAATLLTPDFVEAMNARDASIGLDPLPEAASSNGCPPAVLLGAYMHDSRLDDFTHKKSIWRVSLKTGDGSEFRPAKIKRIGRPDHRLRTSFPFLDRFWVGYLITFEREGAPCGEGQVPDVSWEGSVLELNSIVGRAAMRFGADPDAPSAAR